MRWATGSGLAAGGLCLGNVTDDAEPFYQIVNDMN
jgi:hypothetical protein